MNIKDDDFILKEINEGYLVGGMVRDFVISQEYGAEFNCCDRDIVIKNAEQFAQEYAKKTDSTFITLDPQFKIYRVILKDKTNYLDISELQENSIEEDLLRRDFTINAIAYDLKNNKFIDPLQGIKDIKNKHLRSIKEENFTEDPLRILRAYRFMATLGFEADEELLNILKKHQNLILNPAPERVKDEIMKLFGVSKLAGNGTSKTLIKMYDTGILELIFPFINDMKKVPANSHHHLDLIHHSIETVRQIELQYNKATGEVLGHLQSVDFGGYSRINHLKLAGFLHDIGKYSTWTVEENGKTIWEVTSGTDYPNDKPYRHRFIKHDLEGEKLVKQLLKKLKFSNKQIDYISKLIRYHIYPSNVIASPSLDNKVKMRYVRKMGEEVIDNIFLAKADRLSAQGPDVTKEMTENNINGLNNLLNFYIEVKPTLKPLPKLLDGNEIMYILKIEQSPILGKIINALHEAQLNGEVNTKEEAEAFVKSLALQK